MALPKRTKILLIIALSLASVPVLIIASHFIEANLSQPAGSCTSIEVSLDKAGSTALCEAIVPMKNNYSLELDFVRDRNNKEETKRVSAAVDSRISPPDGRWKKEGKPFQLYITITSEDGEKILNKEVFAPRIAGGTSANVFIRKFTRGKYKIYIEGISDEPAFQNIKTIINFRLYMPK